MLQHYLRTIHSSALLITLVSASRLLYSPSRGADRPELPSNMNLQPPSPAQGTNGERAFTLVEMVVSMAVVSIAMVSVFAALSAGTTVIESTREDLRATQILEEKMETIRLYTMDQVCSNGFVPTNFVAPFYAVGSTNSGLSYTGTVAIGAAPLTESYKDDLKQVTVDLTWVSGARTNRRTVQTLISRYGLQNYIARIKG
jgi:prepilin-type N-terminal cleavage/methylation domain-containing protein